MVEEKNEKQNNSLVLSVTLTRVIQKYTPLVYWEANRISVSRPTHWYVACSTYQKMHDEIARSNTKYVLTKEHHSAVDDYYTQGSWTMTQVLQKCRASISVALLVWNRYYEDEMV